ncbi:hypothetical protein A2U01_0097126, partial [Trifolium medium]|nr:hypothetical protein [Trifolium medium]
PCGRGREAAKGEKRSEAAEEKFAVEGENQQSERCGGEKEE